MAGLRRAPLVLAAIVLPVSGQWQQVEKFSDANCTTSTDMEYSKLMTCVAYGDMGYISQTCEGGKIKSSLYDDDACSKVSMAGTAEEVTCSSQDGEHMKTSCMASLPDGYAGLEMTYYSAAADCTGTSMPFSSAVKVGVCSASEGGGSEIATMTATSFESKKYSTADCTGDATSTESMSCDTCIATGEGGSYKVPCSSLAAAAGSAPARGSSAVSKVAVVALAGMTALLA